MQDLKNPGARPTSEAHMAGVMQALNGGDTARAVMLADQALATGDEHVLFLNLSAFGLEEAGRLEEATMRLRRALQLAPQDVLILTALGNVLSKLGQTEESLVYFNAALALNPRHAHAHNGRATSHAELGQEQEARQGHMRAADLDPNYPDPLGALADFALRDNQPDLARKLAERALQLQPDLAPAAMVLATLEAKAGEHGAALIRLDGLLTGSLAPLHRAAAEQLLGEQLEATGRAEEALDAYVRSNRQLRRIYDPVYASPEVETAVPLARRLTAYFEKADPADWAAAPGGDGLSAGGRGHVFLVGFVRSGTTLLEQVLASHPAVTALEEQATLRAMTDPFFNTEAGLERLRTLSGPEADLLRADYWERVRSFGIDPVGKVFVDKAPLSTLWLPMIAKLFPKAKVLLAIRDPRDVVLSSFKHRFLLNALAWPFTDLTETAEFYAALMELTTLYRAKLPLQLYQHRHEDLVRNFDGEVGRICDFLGLEWTDSLRDFAETARKRDVRTPSKDQVRRGLYSEGMGRWRRYGAGVEPILPILQPWVERYGYDADA